jgi:hypothetical protein
MAQLEVMSMPSKHVIVVGPDYMSQLGILLKGLRMGLQSMPEAEESIVEDIKEAWITHKEVLAVVDYLQLSETFQHVMKFVYKDLEHVLAYVDDVWVMSPCLETAAIHLCEVFQCGVKAGLMFD